MFFRKIAAVLNCLIYEMIFYKNLKISFPSLVFGFNPFRLENGGVINIGNRAVIGSRVEIIAIGMVEIGSNFCINKYSRIVAHEHIVIGKNVTIAQFVSILDHDHKYSISSDRLMLNGYVSSPIIIGNNVWIGDKVTILRGVTIGDNVIVGANSLVNKDIPSNSIVGGVPAKILKIIVEEKNV